MHRRVVIEEELRERLRASSVFPTPVGPRKHERADAGRAVRIFAARVRARTTASATFAMTASSWPIDTLVPRCIFHLEKLVDARPSSIFVDGYAASSARRPSRDLIGADGSSLRSRDCGAPSPTCSSLASSDARLACAQTGQEGLSIGQLAGARSGRSPCARASLEFSCRVGIESARASAGSWRTPTLLAFQPLQRAGRSPATALRDLRSRLSSLRSRRSLATP